MSSRIKYKYRYVIDSSFVFWMLQRSDVSEIIAKLLRINKYSYHNKDSQVLMLQSEFQKVSIEINKNPILKGCIKSIVDFEYLEKHKENYNKNIIFAIDISDEPPYKVRILTTKENFENYQASEHFTKLGGDSIKIRSEELALKTIESDFLMFHNSKSHN